MQKIGIIGGSFNPVHIAHLIIAERFIEQVELDLCVFVPTFISPFKAGAASEYISSAKARFEMLRLAIQYNPKFEIDDHELLRQGISYTFDTVQYFRNKYPNIELYLLIGSDQAVRFTEWKNWQEILESVRLCIVSRPGDFIDASKIMLLDESNHKFPKPININAPLIDISSSEIRDRANHDRSIKFLVPDSVEKYINDNQLYTSS